MAVTTYALPARYTPGRWNALVTSNGTALLHPDFSQEKVQAVWQQLLEGGGLSGCLEVLADGAGGVHQVPDHQGVEHAEAGQRLAEGAEGVEHRIGVEAVGAVGGGQQRPGVDRDPGLAQGPQEHRVEVGGGVDLEVDVLAGVAAQAQGERPHRGWAAQGSSVDPCEGHGAGSDNRLRRTEEVDFPPIDGCARGAVFV